MLGRTLDLKGMQVWDDNGVYVGRVNDIFLDPETWDFKGIGVAGFIIARRAIRKITYKIVLNIKLYDDPIWVRYELEAKKAQAALERERKINQIRLPVHT